MGSLRKEEEGASTLHKKNKKQKKNDEMMSSLGWNIMFTDNLKVLVWYFWAKNLMEIWYLLITEKFLFWSFRQWEIGFFFSQKVDGKMMFGLFELSIFQDLGNMVFRVVLYKLKTQETQTFVFFFPRHTGRFCRTFKIYCYRRRVSKIYKVWERSPQNWSKTFLLVP